MGVQSGRTADPAAILQHNAPRDLEAALQGPEDVVEGDQRHRPRQRKSGHTGKFLFPNITSVYKSKGILSFSFLIQGWTTKAERIKCPAPLPEDPTIPLLTRMLVPVPYQAPEKKAKKKSKEAKGGLRRKGASDIVSEDTKTLSSHDEDEEEEEESNSPLRGERRRERPPWI